MIFVGIYDKCSYKLLFFKKNAVVLQHMNILFTVYFYVELL